MAPTTNSATTTSTSDLSAGPVPSDLPTVRYRVPPRVKGVAVVPWPAEDERRQERAARHEPCVLVLAPDTPPPSVTILEDWVREPVARAELEARCIAVQARAVCGTAPVLDDGLLVHRGAWAAIPPGQVAMVALLVEHFGAVVGKEQLADAARSCGASHHDEAVKTTMTRLGRRVAGLGLVLRRIRGKGYLLEAEGSCPIHGSSTAAQPAEAKPDQDPRT